MSPKKRRTPLAQFVVRERYGRGLTQDDLAKASGVTKQSIINLETGKITTPSPRILHAIAEALGVDARTLFDLMEQGGEEES